MIHTFRSKLYRVDQYNVPNYRTWVLTLLSLSLLYFIIAVMAIFLFYFEQGQAGSNIHTYGDAFWTLQMSASTIGFGDHYPVTWGGRVMVSIIFYLGIGLVGFLGAMIADKILGFADTSVKNRELRKQNADILAHNKELEKKLDELIDRLDKALHK